MAEWFLWLKVIHIVSVIAWMAGLFYLPRLFVYHCSVLPGSEANELFKVMERRLMTAIMRPAAAASLLSGVLLFIAGGFEFLQVWVLGKLAAVFLLCAYHGALEAYLQRFAGDERVRDARFFRILNEFPTLLLIVIVVFIVIKPFQ
ncbi:MAG: protoporphyrinogen oxidase HemJ [Aestuariivirga sp.]